jgi:DegT/DnrJ/EryC1/StrS aminotransferase family
MAWAGSGRSRVHSVPDAATRRQDKETVVLTSPLPRTRRSTFLNFSPPAIAEDEIAAVVDTLRSDWITTGPKTRQFETEFAAYLGADAALALNSCTAGLHVALAALGIGPGDEVI